MKRIIYRLLADYFYIRASKYENVLQIFQDQKDWMKYIRNTGSVAMRRDRCLKLAEMFIKEIEK